ncbi:MAG TPA: sigma-70 family RNA polymerase sigma factor [Gaiellaceae bacterium]
MEGPRQPRTDAQIVAGCREGDRESWNLLVERFSRYVYAICVQGFRLRPADAEDVFQDVFSKVFEHLDRLRDDSAIRPWLAQLTRRTCIDRMRASSRETAADEVEPPAVDDLVTMLDEALTVRAALEVLSPECREILDRFFTRDESYRAISEALALPPGTIASRISRCLDKLKAALEDSDAPLRRVAG